MAVEFPTQGICHHISLLGMILNRTIIVLDQLHPMMLPQIQFRMGSYVLKTFVIGEDLTLGSIQIVPPQFQFQNYRSKFKIVCRIVQLMLFQLPGGIGNHPPVTTQIFISEIIDICV